MSIFRSVRVMFGAAPTTLLGVDQADAKPARCFTSDDDYHGCDFKALDKQGSFEISAPTKPACSPWVDSSGSAAGFVNLDDRNIALPGMRARQGDDAACRANPETATRTWLARLTARTRLSWHKRNGYK